MLLASPAVLLPLVLSIGSFGSNRITALRTCKATRTLVVQFATWVSGYA